MYTQNTSRQQKCSFTLFTSWLCAPKHPPPPFNKVLSFEDDRFKSQCDYYSFQLHCLVCPLIFSSVLYFYERQSNSCHLAGHLMMMTWDCQ